MQEARTLFNRPSLQLSDLHRDEDALDTWFSSWLWPISLFDGITNPDNSAIKYYYPTSVLVTGPDIIFFWVARMIMAGMEYMHDVPFRSVYFTGIVRDEIGRKMSKSLGNSPDPIGLIEKYGADGVRMGMLLAAPAGNDILFAESLCEQGRNFCNKIWNAFRLVQGWQTAPISQPESSLRAIEWFDAIIRQQCAEIEDLYKKYRLNEALMTIFKLFTDEFSGWYLEMIKPAYQAPIDQATYDATLRFFDILMKVIHPFMPFITEEIWQHIYPRQEGESIMTSRLQVSAPFKEDIRILADADIMKQIVAGVRAVRNQKNIAPKEPLVLQIVGQNPVPALSCVVMKMANLSQIDIVSDHKEDGSSEFLVGTTVFAVPLAGLIDVDAEIQKARAQLEHLRGFLAGIEKKLSNENFIAHAPEQVIALERKKKADSESKIATLLVTLEKLKKQ